jgi:Beta protein
VRWFFDTSHSSSQFALEVGSRTLAGHPPLKPPPAYGDYAVSGPAHPSTTWGSIPNIRYTAAEHWLVVRDGRRNRMEEFHRLAFAGTAIS